MTVREVRSTAYAASGAVFLIVAVGCSHPEGSADKVRASTTTLTIGIGSTGASSTRDVEQLVRNIALENLVGLSKEGRIVPGLAELSKSSDGLTVRLRLPSSVTFHDGQPVDAEAVRAILSKSLPQILGPAFDDIAEMRVTSERDIQFSLKRPSAFVPESLNTQIEEPGAKSIVGTGAFLLSGSVGDETEMRANAGYHGGKPYFDRIVIRRYDSMRSAWADMLRGRVDVLFEVGLDALDSLQPSSTVKVFTYERRYAALAVFNTRKPLLRDAGFRRGLNAAIDRQALVSEVFRGHATSAESPVWPHHWAYDPQLPHFEYKPKPLAAGQHPTRLRCLFPDYSSFERMGLAVQKQLQAVGVDLQLEQVTFEQMLARVQAGDFDILLSDFLIGPTPAHAYWYWHSGGQFNYGGFHSKSVDAALDAMRRAGDDAAYKTGFAAFDRAVVDDPPAIFLVWGHRASAVSRRFLVPDDGRDVVTTLRLWRPATEERAASRN